MPVLQGVPQADVATDVEFLRFIAQQTRCGIGIGNVAAHLLPIGRCATFASVLVVDQGVCSLQRRAWACPRIEAINVVVVQTCTAPTNCGSDLVGAGFLGLLVKR
jgi:hypothetical protein